MKQLIFIFTVAWGAVVGSRAQEVLTLDDCLRWGIENNLSLRGQRNEIQKSKYAISENRKLMEWLILTTTSILQCP